MTASSYSRLRSSADEEDEVGGVAAGGHRVDIVLVVAFLMSALSLALYLVGLTRWWRGDGASAPGVLPRPSPYIGLETVAFGANATFSPFVTDPRAIFQISRDDPARRLREEDRQWMSKFGTVVPEEFHFIVTPEVCTCGFSDSTRAMQVLRTGQTSSIVQFRAMDWGMDKCVLNLSIPVTIGSTGVVKSMDIWRLDDDKKLVPHISWRYAPPRRDWIASLDIALGQTAAVIEFVCPSGSFPTFEFECSQGGRDCVTDFWQGAGTGVHLVQSWSKGP